MNIMNNPNKKGKNVIFPEIFTNVNIQDDQEDEIYRNYRKNNTITTIEEERARWEKKMLDDREIRLGNTEAIKKRDSQIKRYRTPLKEKLSQAILRGTEEDTDIRRKKKEEFTKQFDGAYWWLGGKKNNKTKKYKNYKKQKTKKINKINKIKQIHKINKIKQIHKINKIHKIKEIK